MRKAALTFAFLVITIMVIASFSFTVKTVYATDSQEYSIDYVDHKIEVMYDGHIFVKDTITITGRSADDAATLGSFRMGFPYKYGQYVVRYVAYNASSSFQVTPDVPLEDRMGFHAVEIVFAQPLSVRNGTSHVFTVGFVLANDLLLKQAFQNTSRYVLDFPAYPSLTKTVTLCNASIVLPSGAQFVSGTGTVGGFKYTKDNLTAFTYAPETVTFTLAGSKITVVDVKELRREIVVNEFGDISGSDTYRITNKAQIDMLNVEVVLPLNASNVEAEDPVGRRWPKPALADPNTSLYNVTFGSTVGLGNTTTFTLRYTLSTDVYKKRQDAADSYTLTFPMFRNLNCYVETASASFVLPEGAKLQNYNKTSHSAAYSLTRSAFQETVGVSKDNVVSLDSFSIGISYTYNMMWLAFRPALWIWALSLFGCVIAVIWRRPKAVIEAAAPRATGTRLQPVDARAFAGAYQEKLKIIIDLDSLEEKVEKGRIPRRRYKVQKKTLETRLGTLSRTLDDYKQSMRSAGGHYSELMLQLEVAESEIREVDNALKNDQIRHNQGELSLEAFKKRRDNYASRKSDAEKKINGILLRFREESH